MPTNPKTLYRKYCVQTIKWLVEKMCPTYNVNVVFSTEVNDNPNVLAECVWQPEYLQTLITIFPALKEEWDEQDYEQVGRALTHEMCHYYCQPLYDIVSPHLPPVLDSVVRREMEIATQGIAYAIFTTVPRGLYDPTVRAKTPKS